MLYSELQCSEAIHKAVERMGFAEMTEMQEKTIPVMLAGVTSSPKPHRHWQDLCLWHPGGGAYLTGPQGTAGRHSWPPPVSWPSRSRRSWKS